MTKKFIILCGRYRFFSSLSFYHGLDMFFSNKGRFGHKRKLPGFFLLPHVIRHGYTNEYTWVTQVVLIVPFKHHVNSGWKAHQLNFPFIIQECVLSGRHLHNHRILRHPKKTIRFKWVKGYFRVQQLFFGGGGDLTTSNLDTVFFPVCNSRKDFNHWV